MTRRHAIAVAIALAAMVIALAPPLWIRATGDEVALALEPVDPLSLFRGNYVDLNYRVTVELPDDVRWGEAIYVVFDDARPANSLRATVDPPRLGPGETCVQARARGRGNISFPALEQFFVTPEEGGRLERDLANMVGVVRTTGSCQAILVAIEPA